MFNLTQASPSTGLYGSVGGARWMTALPWPPWTSHIAPGKARGNHYEDVFSGADKDEKAGNVLQQSLLSAKHVVIKMSSHRGRMTPHIRWTDCDCNNRWPKAVYVTSSLIFSSGKFLFRGKEGWKPKISHCISLCRVQHILFSEMSSPQRKIDSVETEWAGHVTILFADMHPMRMVFQKIISTGWLVGKATLKIFSAW